MVREGPVTPLRDRQKVHRLAGWLLRNCHFQVARARLRTVEYLQAGCGPGIAAGYVNLDYRWVPGVDVVWDLLRPLPFPANRFRGIYTEHCLEHFFEKDLLRILREFHRVMQPGGLIRIVVPSLEIHARRYVQSRNEKEHGIESADPAAPAHAINEVFYAGHDNMQRSHWSNDGHHFLHDYASLAACLRTAGFSRVRRAAFGQGADPKLLIDQESRAWESLYVEAGKSQDDISQP
jgi:predicted SAM-dependent methyltransferase